LFFGHMKISTLKNNVRTPVIAANRQNPDCG
jgi:hypothetical protein